MIKLVRNKIGTPGILLTIAIVIAFLIGAVVSHEFQVNPDMPVVESASVDIIN